jgi:hypothetical protein
LAFRSYSGISSSAPSYRELEIKVNLLQSKLEEQDGKHEEQDRKFETMINFFMQNHAGQLPPDLAAKFQASEVNFLIFYRQIIISISNSRYVGYMTDHIYSRYVGIGMETPGNQSHAKQTT